MELLKRLINGKVAILSQDKFCKPSLPEGFDKLSDPEKRTALANIHKNVNYDHPDMVDWKGFERALDMLLNRIPVEAPNFDYLFKTRYPIPM